MKQLKTLSLSLLLGLSSYMSVANAELYREDKFIPKEDIAEVEGLLKDLKNKNVNIYSKEMCNVSKDILIKEEISKYCQNILKESLDVLQFKIDLQKDKKDIVVPNVITYKSLSIMYGTFLIHLQKSTKLDNFIELKEKEVEEKKITEKDAIEQIKAFMESKNIQITEEEYDRYIRIKKELDNLIKGVESHESKTEIIIKDKYWMNKMKIMTNERYDKIFMNKTNKSKYLVFKYEVDKMLDSKEIIDMYYKIILSGKVNYIMDRLQKGEMVTLPMEQCQFLKDFEVLSKEGLKALTCIRK